ncbi:hypothetical protein [Mycobacterium leprae]|uniref:hypothetical protein n=1 Tax=Mycobacterium leprae TaxID=1769 RepID=UPI0002F341E7|nr:hypothetical protein [Mycobacterium leprae]
MKSDFDLFLLRFAGLVLQPVCVAVVSADETEVAGRGHDRGQPVPGHLGHRCKQDGVFDLEELCKRGVKRHRYPHVGSPLILG